MGVPVEMFTKLMNIICKGMGWELISQKSHDLLIAFAEEMILINEENRNGENNNKKS